MVASLSEAKAMGGIGSILILLLFVPTVGFFLAIIGFILTLIAVHILSVELGERRIFSDMILAVVLGIVAVAVLGVTVVGAVLKLIGMGSFVGSEFVLNPNLTPGDWIGFITVVLPGLLAVWVLFIVSAIFVRRSYAGISSKLNIRLFETGALIYLIGAITVIVVFGILLIIVSEVIFAIAFFSIREVSGEPKPTQVA